MTSVTDHFGIDGPVPFADVHVNVDNRLFIDPSAIRNGTDKYSKRAQSRLVDYFGQAVEAARSTDPADQLRGRRLLDHTHEPNETRLGMSKREPRGSAFAEGLADDLWDELVENPACRIAAMMYLEDVPLFINFVGPDRISDLTTRIVFDVLADFTDDMMALYPNLKAGQTTEASYWWNPASSVWEEKEFTLPFARDRQLLLVPTNWVFWRNAMDPKQFYNRYSTQAVALERGRRNRKGKLIPASKREIKKEFPGVRKLNNDKTVEYLTKHQRNLAREYQQAVDEKFEPMTQAQIKARINKET